MNISACNNRQYNTFKGWDASRPLDRLLISYPGLNYKIMNELDVIGKQAGFDTCVFINGTFRTADDINNDQNRYQNKNPAKIYTPGMRLGDILVKWAKNNGVSVWVQDIVSLISKNEMIVYISTCMTNFLHKAGLLVNKNAHINLNDNLNGRYYAGGNLYFVKNEDGNELLIGENAVCTPEYDHYLFEQNYKKHCKDFNVNKIVVVPSMDYHLDLFLRPLDNKTVLLTDDNLTEEVIQKGIEVFKEKAMQNKETDKQHTYADLVRVLQGFVSPSFEKAQKTSQYASAKNTQECLQNAGYQIVKVPGRIFLSCSYDEYKIPEHEFNYMNAIVTKNKKGELVYITNKSTFDEQIGITHEIFKETGFSFENEFKKSIAEYVKPENIFFVSGEKNEMQKLLKEAAGGIHCLAVEIPKMAEN